MIFSGRALSVTLPTVTGNTAALLVAGAGLPSLPLAQPARAAGATSAPIAKAPAAKAASRERKRILIGPPVGRGLVLRRQGRWCGRPACEAPFLESACSRPPQATWLV